MVEEKAFRELEAGAERQIRNNQNNRLVDQSKLNGIKVKDQTILAKNKKDEVTVKLLADKGYQDRLEIRKRENEMLHKNTINTH